MRYEEIPEIYYITVVDFIETFLRYGILSRNDVIKKGLPISDCSDARIQDIRNGIKVGSLDLHDYANLYFAKRHPMHYNMVQTQRIAQDRICYICVKRDVLLIPGMYFTDGLAIYSQTRFYSDLGQLDKLAWDIINDPEFLARNPDGTYKYATHGVIKHKKQAEVLVPHEIPPAMFNRVIVFNEDAKLRVKQKINDDLKIEVDRSFYFEV